MSRIVITDTIRKRFDAKPALGALIENHLNAQTRKVVIDVAAATKPELKPLAESVLTWFDDPARFSPKYDDDVQLAALGIVGAFGAQQAFPGSWLESSDLPRALRLTLAGGRYVMKSIQAGLERENTTKNVYVWLLAALLPRAQRLPRDQRVGREVAGDVTQLHPAAQVAIAILFEDDAAINAVADRTLADATFALGVDEGGWARLALIGAIRDETRFDALVRAAILERRLLYAPAPPLMSALRHMSAETMASVVALVLDAIDQMTHPPPAANFKDLMMVAACIDDVRTAELIARHAHVKGVESIGVEYFAQFRHHIGALEAASKTKGKRGASAAAVLDLVGRMASASSSHVESNEGVPPVLLAPPFADKKRKAATATSSVAIPDEPATYLRPGEYTQWLQPWHYAGVRDIASLREAIAQGKLSGPPGPYLEGLMSVIGPESVPLVIGVASASPMKNLELLTHVVSPRAMVALATLLANTKEAPRIRAWLVDHADVAARGLVAAALSSDAKLRGAGRAGVAVLAANGEQSAIDAAAKELRVDGSLLAEEQKLPAPGKMPPFANVATLPTPIVAATGAPLPRAAVENLLAILSVLPKDARHPLADEVRAACTQESLDAFVWALVSDFVLAGARANFDWALFAAGHLGSDVVARKLDASIRQWVQKSVELMQKSLDALALIGTDVALSLLYERGLAAKFEDTQLRARRLLEEVAVRRGVAYEELEDKLVPELGLDIGPFVLDYGARTFVVKLDEQLVPFVIAFGDRKDKPPKPTKTDDAAKATAALLRFETLRDDLSHVARAQLLRFERAMREAREWRVSSWRMEVVRHPLLQHVAPRLVWRVGEELVRVAEDGTFTSASDASIELDDAWRVRVAHVLDAPPDAWAKMTRIFSDYETVQPFPQLARETFDPKESATDVEYTQMSAKKASWNAVDDLLTGRGWHRMSPVDGTVRTLVFPLDRFGQPGAHAELAIAPGLTIGRVKARPEQTLGALVLKKTTFAALEPRVASEVIRDVATLSS
jgi:hypothetical protein